MMVWHFDLLAEGMQLITSGAFETRLQPMTDVSAEQHVEGSGPAINHAHLLDRIVRATHEFVGNPHQPSGSDSTKNHNIPFSRPVPTQLVPPQGTSVVTSCFRP